MVSEPHALALPGLLPDEGLLEPDAPLPASLGRPEPLPPSRSRRVVVGAGASLTGLSLLGGIALVVLGVVAAFSSGADVLDALLVALGFVLVATHWGWVHVAEVSAKALAARSSRDVIARRQHWLEAIEPYARHEVLTEVEPDGGIAIVAKVYRPVPTDAGTFVFVAEVERRELHAPDEPAAAVADRAERLRREAAQATERARQHYATAAEGLQSARLLDADERQRRDVERAASRALSEQLNSRLQDPPLDE